MATTMDLQTAAVLATFSQFSYNPGGLPLPGQQMPTGWNLVGSSVEGNFSAYVYKNTTTDQVAIAYTGTNSLVGDLGATIPTLFGQWSNQYTLATDFAASVQAANLGSQILVTGHSLGGALAQVTSKMFGFGGVAIDPLAGASLVNTPEYAAQALKLTGQTAGTTTVMPSNFVNFSVSGSVVSGATGQQLGNVQSLTSLGFSLSDAAIAVVIGIISPPSFFGAIVGLDQYGNIHAIDQASQTLRLLAAAQTQDLISETQLLPPGASIVAALETFTNVLGLQETRIIPNQLEVRDVDGTVTSILKFSGDLGNRSIEVFAPNSTIPSLICTDSSLNNTQMGNLICYDPVTGMTNLFSLGTGLQTGQMQFESGPSLNITPTADYLAKLAEFIRTEMGVNDADIVNATEIRTLTGAQGGNEVWGGGVALEFSNSGLANAFTLGGNNYNYNVTNNLTTTAEGALYIPDFSVYADPNYGLNLLPDFIKNASLLTFGSGGSDNNLCLAPYDPATATNWATTLPPPSQFSPLPLVNSSGFYSPIISIPLFPAVEPYLYYNNWAGNDFVDTGTMFAPMVLDLDGDGVELISKDISRAYYDVKGDGFKHNIGWVSADDGFLAIDINGDGKISEANELSFALWTATPLDTDADALKAVFDTNLNGQIDAGDAQFSQLRIWQDKNGDGVTDAGELKTLVEAGIVSVSLDVARTNWASGGNLLSGFTTYQKFDGSIGWAADVGLGYEATGWQTTVQSNYVTLTQSGGLKYALSTDVTIGAATNPLNLDLGALDIDGAVGGVGNDIIAAGTKMGAMLKGGAGNDTLTGGAGDDWLDGGTGADSLTGGLGDDVLLVDSADTFYNGGDGFDIVEVMSTTGMTIDLAPRALEAAVGGDGADIFNNSGSGRVVLAGRGGNDTLNGGVNSDMLSGGAGNDILAGGGGNDSYAFGRGDGIDQILDTATVTTQQQYISGADYVHGINRSEGFVGVLGAKVLTISDANLNAYNRKLDSLLLQPLAFWPDFGFVFAGSIVTYDSWNGTYATDLNLIEYPLYNIILSWVEPNPVYAFRDVITEVNAGDDSLILGAGIASTDLEAEMLGADMLLGIRDNSQPGVTVSTMADHITIKNQTNPLNKIETVRFADNTTESTANWRVGTAGNDVLSGDAAANHLFGGGGDDTLNGGAGADIMAGGLGNDSYVVDNASDIVAEAINAGIDIVQSSVTYTMAANVENLTLTGTAAINGTGNELANTITGNVAANMLDGGAGVDTMIGGTGDDTYLVDNIGDVVDETTGLATDIDTVQSSVTYTLGANVENLTLIGTAAINGTGNALSNVLDGSLNTAVNTLAGGTGNDTYIIGAGDVVTETSTSITEIDTVQSSDSYMLSANVENLTLTGTAAINGTGNALSNVLDGSLNTAVNTLAGGAGNDTYIIGTGDVVTETSTSITEIDTVQSSDSYMLSANVENLTLIGTAAINGTGNELANTIRGNVAANILDGGAGVDTMIGGTGNDTYLVDNIGDVVDETTGLATDIDTVQSSITYTLGSNFENLTLTGTAAINGTGNFLNNIITGNASANVLDGGAAGVDTMNGGLGNDTYLVDNIGDVVTETSTLATEIDTVQSSITYTLSANVENLTLTGTAAINGTGNVLSNVLDGSLNTAVNTLAGGTGNDTYIIGAGDIVSETSSVTTEIDTVQSSSTYTLGANVENLTLIGTAAINGTGNELANTIRGNVAANILDGGAGVDTMIGGTGNDTYLVDNIGDVVDETTGLATDIDTVQSSITYTLGANVENLTLTGTAAINGTGNTLNNIITGNAAANVLDGAAGVDTMIGGTGNDTYLVDNIGDVVDETTGLATDIDTVQSSITYTLGANVENLTLTGTAAINGTGNILNNIITGNAAANVLDGAAGVDTMNGGLGNDTYLVDNTGDVVTETSTSITEIDTVQSSITYTLGANVENLTLIGTAAINGTGNALSNVLDGSLNTAVNTLAGGTGNDTYIIGTGDIVSETSSVTTEIDTVQSSVTYTLGANVENLTLTGTAAINGTGNALSNVLDGSLNTAVNTLAGGTGNDTYIIGTGDIVSETSSVTTEIDTVQSSSTYTLGANVENLTLIGTTAINGTGNTLNNIITGNAAANVLDGAAGVDTMNGGLGNDTYLVDNTGDVVTETSTLITEIDTVQSSSTYTLSANVENLTLIGTAAINGTGNALSNVLDGSLNTAVNTLAGGAGNDTYIIGTGDIVSETSSVTTEIDTVQSSVTYTLSSNLENITLIGTAAINGTGNALSNVLDGSLNTAVNTLAGGTGNDTYIIGTGDVVTETSTSTTEIDTVQSSVTYTLGANLENLTLIGTAAINGTGNTLNNIITGNAAANVLDGAAGVDTMNGGLGNDTYLVDNIGDVVTELSALATEIDTVQSSITYTLGANVENLTLTGTAAINGTGNTLNNMITGNVSANVLDGKAGADTMNGGLGNDTYLVDNIGDVVTETSTLATEIDTVQSSITYTLGANFENLILLDTPAIDGVGNGINGVGNERDNTLTGNLGANVLTGGLGNDTYVVNHSVLTMVPARDIVVELPNEGIDTVLYASDQFDGYYQMDANVENLTDISIIDGQRSFQGNALNNIITGNDVGVGDGIYIVAINGGEGADTMSGGSSYVVDNIGDVVIETSTLATEIEEVYSSINYTLGANVENLYLSSTAAVGLSGTGNTLDNWITGAGYADVLNGKEGADSLRGSTGMDTFVFAAGDSVLTLGGTGNAGTIAGFDTILSFDFQLGIGGDTINTVGASTVGANTTGTNGVDSLLTKSGVTVKSHSITSGMIIFDDVDTFASALSLTSTTDVAAVAQYLQANDIGDAGSTVAFTANLGGIAHTYLFTQGDAAGTNNLDVLVDMVGTNALGVSTTATANYILIV